MATALPLLNTNNHTPGLYGRLVNQPIHNVPCRYYHGRNSCRYKNRCHYQHIDFDDLYTPQHHYQSLEQIGFLVREISKMKIKLHEIYSVVCGKDNDDIIPPKQTQKTNIEPYTTTFEILPHAKEPALSPIFDDIKSEMETEDEIKWDGLSVQRSMSPAPTSKPSKKARTKRKRSRTPPRKSAEIEPTTTRINAVNDDKDIPSTITIMPQKLSSNEDNTTSTESTPEYARKSAIKGKTNISINNQQEIASRYKDTGNNFMKKKHFKTAKQCYHKAMELDPSNAVYYANLSAACYALNEYQNALDWGRQATNTDDKWNKGYLRVALAAYKMKEFKEAKANFKVFLKSTKKNEMTKKYNDLMDNCDEEIEQEIINTDWMNATKEDIKNVDTECPFEMFRDSDYGQDIDYDHDDMKLIIKSFIDWALEIIMSGWTQVTKIQAEIIQSDIHKLVSPAELYTGSPQIQRIYRYLDDHNIPHNCDI